LIARHLPNAAAAFAEVGDIRRRLGDLDRAEDAFARAEELSGRTCLGTALLRLAQGRVEAAMRIIGGCMSELTDLVTDVGETRTVAVESEDAAAVIAAVRELGLGSLPNTSFPRGLKALAG
jgi:ferric-dicitrate binding protein FerR (iron transport regulator)